MGNLVQQTAITSPIRMVINDKHVQGFCELGQDPAINGSILCESLHLPTHLFCSPHSVYVPGEVEPQALEKSYWTVRNNGMLPIEFRNLFAFVPAMVGEDAQYKNWLRID